MVTRQASEIWRDYDTDGVPSSGPYDPRKDYIRTWGGEIEDSVSNGVAGAKYTFSTSTDTASDPGSGYVAFNLASPSPEGVTEIAVSDYDVLGRAFANFWQTLDNSTTINNRATIIIRDPTTDDIAIFRVNDTVTDESGWTRIPVEWVEGAGGFADETSIGVVGVQTGDTGGNTLAIPIFDTASPVSGEVMWAAPVPTSVFFPAGLGTSYGVCSTTPTADATFSFRKAAAGTDPAAATEFGTATFGAGSRTPTFAAALSTSFSAGDTLVVVAPDPKDATLARPALTLVASTS